MIPSHIREGAMRDLSARIRSVLDARGLDHSRVRFAADPAAIVVGGKRHRVGPGEFDDAHVARLADVVQVALRAQAIKAELRRLATAAGGPVPAEPAIPAWALACHPYALAYLERTMPGGGWMREPTLWSSSGPLRIEDATLVVDSMRILDCYGNTTAWLTTSQTDPAFVARPSTTANLSRRLSGSEAKAAQGGCLADLVSSYHPVVVRTDDPRIDLAVRGVRVASAKPEMAMTMVQVEPAEWIAAAVPPEGVDPSCLSIPLPLR